ncbi:Ribosomal protein lysine methyltransferase [Tilletia horrida]|uniref:Ribosomal protein lysine methyltransferase n=1 Tax=Tilletia horrida TaxID=155126 RepID=A0AAN6JJG0_9BASI|nr:Ribosomal protein lysine methyltransferase [Tilletia horrida]
MPLIRPRPGTLRPVEDPEDELFHLFTSLKDQGEHGLGYTTVHSDRVLIQISASSSFSTIQLEAGLGSTSAGGGVGGGGKAKGKLARAAGRTRTRTRTRTTAEEGAKGPEVPDVNTTSRNVFSFPSGTVTISAVEDEDDEDIPDTNELVKSLSNKAGSKGRRIATTAATAAKKGGSGLVMGGGRREGGGYGTHSAVLRQDFTSFRSVAGNTGSVAWRSSLALALLLIQDLHLASSGSQHARRTSLLHPDALFPPSPQACPRANTVLELGAGTGVLSSLVLSHPSLASISTGLRWIATDQGEVLDLLRRNVDATSRRIIASQSQSDASASFSAPVQLVARDLDWMDVLSLSKRTDERAKRQLEELRRSLLSFTHTGPGGVDGDTEEYSARNPDLILAIDCIFNPALFPALLATLALFSSSYPPSSTSKEAEGRQTQVLIACELREADMMRAFLEAWCGYTDADGDAAAWDIHAWHGAASAEEEASLGDHREDHDGLEGSGLGPGFVLWLATRRHASTRS